MRSLVISIIALSLILGSWGLFMGYANKSLRNMIQTVKNEVMVEVVQDNWDNSEKALEQVSSSWYRGRKGYSIFLNARSIDDIESSISKALAYVRMKEKANALGELAYLHHQLIFLLENEMILLENIL
ncbi:MAG: DUF4363 family protein [Syntrophomonadaceae bacterium]|nr:DUF4363 family protein [Syntrophomonadaceae bacterium]